MWPFTMPKLLVQHLGQRRQAVGRARRVRDHRRASPGRTCLRLMPTQNVPSTSEPPGALMITRLAPAVRCARAFSLAVKSRCTRARGRRRAPSTAAWPDRARRRSEPCVRRSRAPSRRPVTSRSNCRAPSRTAASGRASCASVRSLMPTNSRSSDAAPEQMRAMQRPMRPKPLIAIRVAIGNCLRSGGRTVAVQGGFARRGARRSSPRLRARDVPQPGESPPSRPFRTPGASEPGLARARLGLAVPGRLRASHLHLYIDPRAAHGLVEVLKRIVGTAKEKVELRVVEHERRLAARQPLEVADRLVGVAGTVERVGTQVAHVGSGVAHERRRNRLDRRLCARGIAVRQPVGDLGVTVEQTAISRLPDLRRRGAARAGCSAGSAGPDRARRASRARTSLRRGARQRRVSVEQARRLALAPVREQRQRQRRVVRRRLAAWVRSRRRGRRASRTASCQRRSSAGSPCSARSRSGRAARRTRSRRCRRC